jgi:hypothetical protein
MERTVPVSLINGTFKTAGFEDKIYLGNHQDIPLDPLFTMTHQKSLISQETYEQLGLEFSESPEDKGVNDGTPVPYSSYKGIGNNGNNGN